MHPNKEITRDAFNNAIAMKWLLVFPVSDLLRAISVIKEKSNKQGPFTTIEDKHDGVNLQENPLWFQPYYPRRELKLVSLLRCVRIADFWSLRRYL